MPTKKQLQEENEKLKKTNDCVRDFCNHVEEYMTTMNGGNPPPSASEPCLGCRLGGFLEFHNGLIEDWKELKEENETLNSNGQEQHDHYENEISNLKEENEKLKIDMINHTTQNYSEWKKEQETLAIGLVREDLKRAEEENEKLKKQIDELFDATDYPVNMIEDGYTKLDAIYEWVHNRDEEIDELKEENEVLKEENERLTNDIDGRSKISQEGVKRMIRLSGLGYDITKCRQVNMNLMEKVIMEKNEELKKQIPDKKGKKLSQADKELLWDISIAWERSDGPGPDEEEGKKLLYRLLK